MRCRLTLLHSKGVIHASQASLGHHWDPSPVKMKMNATAYPSSSSLQSHNQNREQSYTHDEQAHPCEQQSRSQTRS
jgi:hypothetical protein